MAMNQPQLYHCNSWFQPKILPDGLVASSVTRSSSLEKQIKQNQHKSFKKIDRSMNDRKKSTSTS